MNLYHLGDEPVTARLNLKRELRRLRQDPMSPLLGILQDEESLYLHGDVGRYVQAFEFFYLSAERCLHNTSVGTRYHRQVTPSLGGGRRLSVRQRRLAREFSSRAPFFRVDLVNLLVHSRVLLDRIIALSRRFLVGPRLPSFSSFAEHKRFFHKYPDAFSPQHSAYSRYIRDETAWFDIPVKAIRDKIVVHPGPRHFQFITYPSEHDMGILLAMDARRPWTDHPQASSVRFSARRTLCNVWRFLEWYNRYAMSAVRGTGVPAIDSHGI